MQDAGRLRRQSGDVVEVEDVAVEDQLDRPLCLRIDVFEQLTEVFIEEESAPLVGLPMGALGVGRLGVGQVHIRHDDRLDDGRV